MSSAEQLSLSFYCCLTGFQSHHNEVYSAQLLFTSVLPQFYKRVPLLLQWMRPTSFKFYISDYRQHCPSFGDFGKLLTEQCRFPVDFLLVKIVFF